VIGRLALRDYAVWLADLLAEIESDPDDRNRLGLTPCRWRASTTSPIASYLALEAGDLVRRSPLFLRSRKRVHHFLRRRDLRANRMAHRSAGRGDPAAHLEGRVSQEAPPRTWLTALVG
jgi:hypothetical protein